MASFQVADSLATAIYNKIKTTICNLIYPVGSIKITVVNTNPSTYLGGTWVAWGSGRVPVGVNTSETEFKTVEKTGGSKYLQDHWHKTYIDFGGTQTAECTGYSYTSNSGRPYQPTTGVQNVTTGNSGNLQPYITCYMWKRTA